MTTSNTAFPLSRARQDKKTSSHSSAPNGRARECRECAGDVAPREGTYWGSIRSDPDPHDCLRHAHTPGQQAIMTTLTTCLASRRQRLEAAAQAVRAAPPYRPAGWERVAGVRLVGAPVRRSRAHDDPQPTTWRRSRTPFRSSATLIGSRGGRRSRWATMRCDAAIEMGDSQRTPRTRAVGRARGGVFSFTHTLLPKLEGCGACTQP